jgi:hypothetical protein
MNRVLGPTSNPRMADLINKAKEDVLYNLNAVQIGTIQSYSPAKNLASITINYKRQLPTGDTLDYPLLVDCPVFILSGGDADISMPIETGDQCIILFNDRDIDNWHYSGDTGVPSSSRAHSLADGMALVGIRNLKTATPTSTTTLRINAGSNKVAIKNNAANMATLMDSFIDTIISITVGPTNIPLSPAAQTALTAFKLQWRLLLDEGAS